MAGGGRLNEVGPYHCQHHHVDGHDDDGDLHLYS